MNESNTPQAGPEDIRLALELNRFIETGDSAGLREESLFNALENYKQSVQLKQTSTAGPGLWDSIENQITKNNQATGKTARIFTLQSPYLKIAAAFMAVVLLSILYLFFPQTETDYLAAADAEKTELILDDGSVVTLRPYSRLSVVEETSSQVTYRVEGEGFFDVVSNQNRTFSVLADGGRVDVLGTRFTLSNWSRDVRVYLEEGSVRFSETESDQFVTLEPGEYSLLREGGLTEPQSGDEAIFTGWMESIISLEQRSLRDIAAELSHHYNVELIIPDEAGDESLSGSLQLGDLIDVLEDIALSLGGEFIQTGDRSYRFTTNPQ